MVENKEIKERLSFISRENNIFMTDQGFSQAIPGFGKIYLHIIYKIHKLWLILKKIIFYNEFKMLEI